MLLNWDLIHNCGKTMSSLTFRVPAWSLLFPFLSAACHGYAEKDQNPLHLHLLHLTRAEKIDLKNKTKQKKTEGAAETQVYRKVMPGKFRTRSLKENFLHRGKKKSTYIPIPLNIFNNLHMYQCVMLTFVSGLATFLRIPVDTPKHLKFKMSHCTNCILFQLDSMWQSSI